MISSILLETPLDYEAGTVILHLDRKYRGETIAGRGSTSG